MKINLKTRSLKQDPNESDIRGILEGHFETNFSELPVDVLKPLYRKLIVASKEYQGTKGRLEAFLAAQRIIQMTVRNVPVVTVAEEAKNAELKKICATLIKSINKLKKELASYNTLKAAGMPKSICDKLLHQLYTSGNRLEHLTVGENYGVYRHLTLGSNGEVFARLNELGTLDEKSILYDFGSGLLIPLMHAAIAYGCQCVGVEGSRQLCNLSATLYQEMSGPLMSNCVDAKVALVNADFVTLRPIERGTHAFLFDCAFSPEDWLRLIQIIARSSFEYVVTFKPCRFPDFQGDILTLLQATIVDSIGPLKFSGGKETAKAYILKRNPVFQGGQGAVDTELLADSFFCDTEVARLARYQSFISYDVE